MDILESFYTVRLNSDNQWIQSLYTLSKPIGWLKGRHIYTDFLRPDGSIMGYTLKPEFERQPGWKGALKVAIYVLFLIPSLIACLTISLLSKNIKFTLALDFMRSLSRYRKSRLISPKEIEKLNKRQRLREKSLKLSEPENPLEGTLSKGDGVRTTLLPYLEGADLLSLCQTSVRLYARVNDHLDKFGIPELLNPKCFLVRNHRFKQYRFSYSERHNPVQFIEASLPYLDKESLFVLSQTSFQMLRSINVYLKDSKFAKPLNPKFKHTPREALENKIRIIKANFSPRIYHAIGIINLLKSDYFGFLESNPTISPSMKMRTDINHVMGPSMFIKYNETPFKRYSVLFYFKDFQERRGYGKGSYLSVGEDFEGRILVTAYSAHSDFGGLQHYSPLFNLHGCPEDLLRAFVRGEKIPHQKSSLVGTLKGYIQRADRGDPKLLYYA